MHILVTGGTGLIGTALCAALVDQGCHLTVLSRSARDSSQGRTFVTDLEQCVSPVDAVINLAGAGLADRRWTAGYKRTIARSRIDLTQQLVSWIESQATRPKTLISASAIGYYGASQDDAFTEQGPPGTGFAADLCQRWEQEALRAEALAVDVAVLRLGVVLASEGGALGKMTQSFRFGVESWLGDGEQWLSWIHIEDVVRAIQFVLAADPRAKTYNTTAPEPVTHRAFAHEVGRHSGSFLKMGVPSLAARLLAGEMAEELLLSGQRVLPQALIEQGFEFAYPTLPAALDHLLGQ